MFPLKQAIAVRTTQSNPTLQSPIAVARILKTPASLQTFVRSRIRDTREFTYDEETQTETLTETVTVKQTYKQEWSAYNQAQTNEKECFLSLLADLCKGIEAPEQTNGRPRLPLGDMVFASAFKTYSTVSGRRFMTDLKDAHGKGYLTRAPHYNSISPYLENPGLTPILKSLIEESSLPLQAVESDFAVEPSGFSTSRFDQWMKVKYGKPELIERRQFIKCHLMCGIKTNIVTSVEMTDGYVADSPQFKGLVETTAKNFTMQEVSADKAYLSAKNLQVVVDHHAQPYEQQHVERSLAADTQFAPRDLEANVSLVSLQL